MAQQLTDANFETEVLQSPVPYLVDFWAPWCGPCRMVAPVIDEIAEEYNGKMKVGKVNVDEAPQIAAKYNIMSIPTIALFKGGESVETIVGAVPKEHLLSAIMPHL